MLLRRVKHADGDPFALEERLMPMNTVSRLTREIFRENLPVFKILEDSGRTNIVRVTYIISGSPLTRPEADVLQTDLAAPILRREGICFDARGEPVMFSQVTFLADKIELRFEFHKEDSNWGAISLI